MWHGAEAQRHYVLTNQDTLMVISLTNEQSSGLGTWTIQHRDQKICALDVQGVRNYFCLAIMINT